MKTFTFAPLVLLFATLVGHPAFAVKAHLRATALVGQYQDAGGNAVFVHLNFPPSGKIMMTVNRFNDPNPTRVLEEPTVIKDSRPMDGSLYLKVGTAELIVGSGNTMDGSISYRLQYENRTVDLKPIVNLDLR